MAYGTLYLIPCPISDETAPWDVLPAANRAVMNALDYFIVENTRSARRFLSKAGIERPIGELEFRELNEHTAAGREVEELVKPLLEGRSAGVISEAGVPGVADPGVLVVEACHRRGIRVVPVPGASAADTALIASGQCTGRFVFEGFLPTNRRQKKERLAALQAEQRTVIFYEAPHKLPTTLADLEEAFGPNRPLTVCRELTKLHEEIRKTTIGAANIYYKQNAPRGEFVLVMAGAQPAPQQAAPTLAQAAAQARALVQAQGMPLSAAAKQAAAGTPFSKSEIYKACLGDTAQAAQKEGAE